MPITFAPTYKFDPGTNIYDTRYFIFLLFSLTLYLSDKNRVPSWTDRILFSASRFTPQKYDRAEIDISDHKPVVLTGTLEVSNFLYFRLNVLIFIRLKYAIVRFFKNWSKNFIVNSVLTRWNCRNCHLDLFQKMNNKRFLLSGVKLKMSQPEPIFVDINPDQPVTLIESVCISCYKNVKNIIIRVFLIIVF